MQIQPNQSVSGLPPAALNRIGKPKPPAQADQVDFAKAALVERALAETPEIRAQVVERARELVSDPDYPPRETIDRLAKFLAGKLSSDL